uniref:POU class 2 homeobox 1 n=1 Tax=Chrysemys picta bellii TaxID=8478 RepID=A0A8C3FFN0_CHRPI
MLDCSDYVLDSRMNNPSETSKPPMESGDGNTGTQTNGLDFQKQPVPVGGAISTAQAQAFLGHLHQVQLAGTSLQAAAQSLNVQSKSNEESGDTQQPSQPSQQPSVQAAIPQTQLMLAGGQITGLTLTPAQQQLLLQQAQAQLLAAAVQHSASQQHSAAGATISASAATPMTQIPLSQPIQIAQDLQHLQQLQQQNLNLQQFVLVHPTTNLQPAQFIISQTPQGQQGLLQAQNLLTQLPQQSQANLLQSQPSITLTSQVSFPSAVFQQFFGGLKLMCKMGTYIFVLRMEVKLLSPLTFLDDYNTTEVPAAVIVIFILRLHNSFPSDFPVFIHS